MNWIETDSSHQEVTCELVLKTSTVAVTFRSPTAEPDEVRFEVNELTENDDRMPVGELSTQEGDEDWGLLHELYLAASKVAYHWDKVLTEVETAINTAGRIGIAPDVSPELEVSATRRR